MGRQGPGLAATRDPQSRLVTWCGGRRLLAVRPVRGRRLYPSRRQPGGRPGGPRMPGSGPAPWPPSAITTTSRRSGS